MMHGVLHTGTLGHIKVDGDDTGANVRTRESCGVGDRCRRRVVGTRECVEMGKSGCV